MKMGEADPYECWLIWQFEDEVKEKVQQDEEEEVKVRAKVKAE